MKNQIIIGLFFLLLFCFVSGSAQQNFSNEEKIVTEFVKLKNVPDCAEKESAYCFGRKVSYKNFRIALKNYLTLTGEIEFDRRSKVIIITDADSNISPLKAAVSKFDYAEIFLIDENEKDLDETGGCTGFAGSPSN